MAKQVDVPSHVGHWLIWWVACMALWLLLTGTFDVFELAAGAISSAVGATAATLVRAQKVLRFDPDPAWLLRIHKIPRHVVSDTWTVFGALFKHLLKRKEVRGEFRAIPFDPGGDDARAATRRALIAGAISVSPNSYVVGVDRERKLILCHQLVPSPKAEARRDITGWF